VGELAIAGAGVSPGYWRDEARTGEAFVPDPRPGRTGRVYRTGDLGRVDSDGDHHFLGRADTQIKSRGYRIELGEVEAAVNGVGGVAECAVVAIDSDGFEGKTICCAYALASGAELPPAALRRQLSRVLPRYMLPSLWEPMAALPKNVNGKVDRRLIGERFAG
jgi:acyl-coenzyme A synthetase/AMP-(fatty) acid ligase